MYKKTTSSGIPIVLTGVLFIFLGFLLTEISPVFLLLAVIGFFVMNLKDVVEINLSKNEIYYGVSTSFFKLSKPIYFEGVQSIYTMCYAKKTAAMSKHGFSHGTYTNYRYGVFVKDFNGQVYEIATFKNENDAIKELQTAKSSLNIVV